MDVAKIDHSKKKKNKIIPNVIKKQITYWIYTYLNAFYDIFNMNTI